LAPFGFGWIGSAFLQSDKIYIGYFSNHHQKIKKEKKRSREKVNPKFTVPVAMISNATLYIKGFALSKETMLSYPRIALFCASSA